MDNPFTSGTYCSDPASLNYETLYKALDLLSKYQKDNDYIEGIFVTKSHMLPNNTSIYKINAPDGKKYIAMHSDTFKKITENLQLVKEEYGIPMFYGIPVKINDEELFKIWISSIIKE